MGLISKLRCVRGKCLEISSDGRIAAVVPRTEQRRQPSDFVLDRLRVSLKRARVDLDKARYRAWVDFWGWLHLLRRCNLCMLAHIRIVLPANAAGLDESS